MRHPGRERRAVRDDNLAQLNQTGQLCVFAPSKKTINSI